MSENQTVYNEDNIKELDPITHIRTRPAMYIDGIGQLGLYKIDSEVVQNAFDEFLIHAATKCIIDYDSITGMMRVEDDGRGIPLGKLESIMTKVGAGGKFDRDAYEFSSGQNAVGIKAVCALSTKLKVEVWRDSYTLNGKFVEAQHGWMTFECGKKTGEFFEELPGSHLHGTVVEYYSDDSILKTHERDVKKFMDYLNIISYIDPGIYIEYNVDGTRHVFQHTGGLQEFITDFMKSKNLKCVMKPLQITGSEDNLYSYDCIMTYGPKDVINDMNIISYVNGNRTPSHGVHVSAVKAGMSAALTQYIQDSELIPKSMQNLNVTGSLISNNIIGIVGVRHRDPLFNGQTKEAFKSDEVYEPIKREARNTFMKWLHENPNEAKKLVNLAIDYAKYEAERKKLKKNMVDAKNTKSIFDSSIDPTKYKTCKSNDPSIKELFIVEGDSAGGGINLVRDSNFQALYDLTGKIMNVATKGANSTLSTVILNLAQITGLGLPVNGKVNYDKLAYNKFIILTDADDDGSHIRTLLLTFFYTFYPELIERGHVFFGNPPIKKLIMNGGKTSFYIHTEADYDRLMKEYIVNTFELHSEKTGMKLSEGLFRTFIDANVGYNIMMDNHAATLALDPSLLEHIIINISDVSGCTSNKNDPHNRAFYKKTGYTVKRIEGTDVITFDKGVYHANVKLDKAFVNEHFDEICAKLNEIAIYGVYLKGIRSGHDYHGTLYDLNVYMSGILGKKVIIQRFKGLGEMNPMDLVDTINPARRRLTKVTMEEAEKAERAVRVFMTNSHIEFKRLFYAGKTDFD